LEIVSTVIDIVRTGFQERWATIVYNICSEFERMDGRAHRDRHVWLVTRFAKIIAYA
jgi:hypothetical protein